MAEKAETKANSGEAMRIDGKLVRELAELLTANELSEIEVEDGPRRIRVKRELYAAAPAMIAAPAAPAPATAAPAAAPAAAEPAVASGEQVKSPMVGTAYLAAQPGGPPFVAAGATVKQGETLLIVEAMKVLNPITAPRAGTVKQVLVSDGQPVEFDQPLVVIE